MFGNGMGLSDDESVLFGFLVRAKLLLDEAQASEQTEGGVAVEHYCIRRSKGFFSR